MKKSYILMVLWALLTSLNAISLPKLSSFPSALATIFLDFDGQYVVSSSWNNGNALNCAASGMNDAQITEIFNRVSEHYRPFNLNITTDSTVFLAAPLTKRIRIIVTPTSSWYTGVGGISYTGSFTWGDDTPAFVFCDRLGPNNAKMVAECCTHESGHSLGLSHQSLYNSNCTLIATYNAGTGTGGTGWAPVMGNSYYKNSSGWNNGPTPYGCTSNEDNLLIISTANGFTYRTDDYPDAPGTNSPAITITNQTFSASGLIATNTDKDAFKFSFTQKGALHLHAAPYAPGVNLEGASLDVKVTLVNAALQTIGTYDPSTSLDATIDTTLNAGDYYVVLQGTGNANASTYSSLGSYDISGTFVAAGALPIRDAALTGKSINNAHNLNWNIISDDPIKNLVLESSTNGRDFSTLSVLAATAKSFTYTPSTGGDIFYRLKVTSVVAQTVYSNVISIKSPGSNNIIAEKAFKVSTLVHDQITVNASANYQYQLVDINGRMIATGNSNAGSNRINVSNIPNGIYVIQLINNNQKQTERIIKQ
jgi:hypothetical protein